MPIWTRRRPNLSECDVALATKTLTGNNGDNAASVAEKRRSRIQQSWQEEAFTYADLLGEVKYAYRYLGKAMGKLRPYPAVIDPGEQDRAPVAIEDYHVDADPENDVEGKPLPQELIDAAQVEVARVRDSQGNVGPILRRLGENLFIVGEVNLVGQPKEGGDGEEWSAKSIAELHPSKTDDGTWEVQTTPGANEGTPLPAESRVVRIWSPHPKWGELADSSMRGALDTCDELLTLSRSIRGVALSRLAGAGIFALAQELTFGPADKTKSGNAAAEDNGDPLTAAVLEAAMKPISDPASAAAAVPLFMRVPADMIKDKSWADHKTFDRSIDAEMAAQRDELRGVLAMDLDIPPEILQGKGDANHWSAWQIDEDTFKGHIEPDAQLIFDAWTTGLLRPALKDQFPGGKYDDLIERIVVWYDATAVVIRMNRSDDADKAFDRYAISYKTYRAAKGFTEDDAPSDEEVQERADLKAVEKGKPEEQIQTPTGETNSPPPGAAGAQMLEGFTNIRRATELSLSAAEAGRGGLTHLGVRLQRIDSDLRSRLLAASDSAMRRAMQKAGVKVKSKVSGRGASGNRHGSVASALTGVAPENICSTLGRGIVQSLGLDDETLLADAFTETGEQFSTWVADSQARVRQLLKDAGVSDDKLEHVATRHQQDREAAQAEFIASLNGVAQDRLYSSTPDDDKGEFSGTLVSVLLLRVALAVAGGSRSSEGSSGVDSRGLPAIPGDPPVLGVANGPTTVETLAGENVSPDRYEWVYGVSTRPFEPHVALDGVQFEAWDDGVLSNPDAWPPVSYYVPGDHEGCSCDAVPTYVAVEDARPEFNRSGEPLSQAASAGRPA